MSRPPSLVTVGPAVGLVCQKCGYLHTFVAGVRFWKPEGGYPEPAS